MLRKPTDKRGFASRMMGLLGKRRRERPSPVRGRRLSLEPLETRTLLVATVSMSPVGDQGTIVERDGGGVALNFSITAEEGDDLQASGYVRVLYTISGLEPHEYVDGGCGDGSVLILTGIGQTSAQVTITFLNDAIADGDDTCTITLDSAEAAWPYPGGGCEGGGGCCCGGGGGCCGTHVAVEAGQEATVTIQDDDDWAIKVEVDPTKPDQIVERGGASGFSISRVDGGSGRSGDTSYAIAVDIVMSGAATIGSDYRLVDESGYPLVHYWNGSEHVWLATIPQGSGGVGVALQSINDPVREPDEDAVLSVVRAKSVNQGDGYCEPYLYSGPDGTYGQTGPDATVTILDDDWWKVGITAAGDAAEPDDDSWAMYEDQFTLTRTKDRAVAYEMDTSYGLQVKVQVPVADPLADPQTIATYDVDYSLCPGTVYEGENPGELFATFVIPQGATSKSIDMTVWNDGRIEDDEDVTLTVLGPAPGAGDPEFTVDAAAASATVNIKDNDHWLVEVQATDGTASERLSGVVSDPGWFTFTRIDDGSSRSGDVTYAIEVTMEVMEVLESTSPAYAHWAPSGPKDYDFITANEPGENEVFLSGFTYVNSVSTETGGVWTVVDTFRGSIPAEETSAKLKVQPTFDWEDEGEQFNPGTGTPDGQAGEIVDLSVVSAAWPGLNKPGTSRVGANADAEVEIKDGGIILARTDSDNDGDLHADDDEEEEDPASLGRVFMVNTDDDNDNDVADNWERPDNFDTPANSSAWDAGTEDSRTVANENDLAATRFYAWVHSLDPKDPGNPVRVDIYASGSIDLVLWTQATKGRRLHYGKDVSPADGRMDEETRLITLDQSTTSFDKTVYVEANTYSGSKRPVSLCADVVNGGPDGSDATYYTTLKVDALAMAFNHDASNAGGDGVNLRSNVTANTEHSAPEWYPGPLTLPSPLPNDGLVNQRTVLYLNDKAVTTYNRIAVDPKYQGMAVKMKARVTGGAIGGLASVTFVVDADGILQPQGGVTSKAVNGVTGFAEFAATNNTSSVIRREDARFYWEVTYIGADVTHGNAAGSNEAVITDPIRMYTVLDTPGFSWSAGDPWDVSDTAADDLKQPWAIALDFVTQTAGTSGHSAASALAQLTGYLHGNHGMSYDTTNGAAHYGFAAISGTFHLTSYLNGNGTVNCYDQAAGLTVLGRLVGIDVNYYFMAPFGYINEVDLVGVGSCNNPFFSDPTCSADHVITPPHALTGSDGKPRSGFGNHAFTMFGGGVYDACAGPVTGTALGTYLTNTIDTTATIAAGLTPGTSGDETRYTITSID